MAAISMTWRLVAADATEYAAMSAWLDANLALGVGGYALTKDEPGLTITVTHGSRHVTTRTDWG